MLRVLSVFGATASLFACCRQGGNAGASSVKAVYGERHCAEKLAGIGVGCCRMTLLVGNAIVGCLNEKLGVSLYSDGGKDTEGNIYPNTVLGTANLTLYTASDIIGNVAAASTQALLYLCAKHYRLNHLNDCLRLADSTVKSRDNRAIASVCTRCIRGYITRTAE